MSQQSSSQGQDLNRRILEKIASDPQFRKQLLDNPERTIENSEFGPEVKRLASQPASVVPNVAPSEACTWTCAWTGANQ